MGVKPGPKRSRGKHRYRKSENRDPQRSEITAPLSVRSWQRNRSNGMAAAARVRRSIRLLVAWCELRQSFRHFRTDRIVDFEVLEETNGLRHGELRFAAGSDGARRIYAILVRKTWQRLAHRDA